MVFLVVLGLEEIERLLHAAWVVDPSASLRADERRKAVQLAALVPEILRLKGGKNRGPGLLIDAAAGRGPVGLAAALALAGQPRSWRALALERDPARVALLNAAALRLSLPLEARCCGLDQRESWPEEPDLVASLHACGGASDLVIDQVIRSRARALLLVPCCYGAAGIHDDGPYLAPRAQARATAQAEALGLPEAALVRGRFSRAMIDAERTLRLEAAGYQTEVVELYPVSISPFNLLWRARRVGESRRMARAQERLVGFTG